MSGIFGGDTNVSSPDEPQLGEVLDDIFQGLEGSGALVPGKRGKFFKFRQQQIKEELELTKRFGLAFGKQLQGIKAQLIEDDPLAFALQQSTLEGLEDERQGRSELLTAARAGVAGLSEGGLPADVESRLRQRARSGALSRGLELNEFGSFVSETANVLGGEEAFRSQRLGQLSGALGSSAALTGRGLPLLNVPQVAPFGLGAPSFAELGGLGLSRQQIIQQGNIATAGNQAGQNIALINAAGNIGSSFGQQVGRQDPFGTQSTEIR